MIASEAMMTSGYAGATDGAAGHIPDFPMVRASGCPFDPPPALRALQAQAPISKVRLWDGSTPWLVTRYSDQRALLADRRVSRDTALPCFPHASAGLRAQGAEARTFVCMDDPEHARLRRIVTARFAIKRVEAVRPAIQRVVETLIDEMLAGPKPVDLVHAFALPVPSWVICQLLGVPYADHDFFHRSAGTMLSRDASVDEQLAAQRELIDYLAGLAAGKLAKPADDLLSWLVLEQVKTGAISIHDVAAMGTLLLVAGHDTTTNMIALGTLALLRHPDQLAALRRTDDPALIADAVEELLRYLTIVHIGLRRVALADVEIGGQVIHAGEGVIFPTNVANRDK
jgi:cytochrome P450